MRVFFKRLVHTLANIGQFYIIAFITLYICTRFGKLTYLLVEPAYELLGLFILLIIIDVRNMSNAQNNITLRTRESLLDLVETLKIIINMEDSNEEPILDFVSDHFNKDDIVDQFICKESEDKNITVDIRRDEALVNSDVINYHRLNSPINIYWRV